MLPGRARTLQARFPAPGRPFPSPERPAFVYGACSAEKGGPIDQIPARFPISFLGAPRRVGGTGEPERARNGWLWSPGLFSKKNF
jgi:hypothetical protein